MEASPLIKAHDHARAASVATQTSDTTVAINEHARAAGEFANAATNTTSVEALRTLRLLEQHHKRLSELLKIPLDRPAPYNQGESDAQITDEKESSQPGADAVPSLKSETSSGSTGERMPSLSKQRRYPGSRDLGSSIASNLASARGIRSKYRSQPLSPSVSNDQAPGSLEVTSRRTGSRNKMQNMLDHAEKPGQQTTLEKTPSKLVRQDTEGSQAKSMESTPTSPTDEGFSRFYSAFGSIINRISAPLAFAGLPLVAEEPVIPEPQPTPETQPQRRNRARPTISTSASTEPDLNKLYSRATLRALSRDGPSVQDSFYVVPTSGHTVSYANILTFADKEKRRLELSILPSEMGDIPEDPDEEDFVDAKETQIPQLSPGFKKKVGKGRQGADNQVYNVVEELYLENKSLKDMLDKLSKRLHAFEAASQNSGMALAESMRLRRPGSPASLPPREGSGLGSSSGKKAILGADNDEPLKKRNMELEEQLLAASKQLEEMDRDYKKMKATLGRYRDKWEQLKAGAKARRAGSASTQAVTEGGDDTGKTTA